MKKYLYAIYSSTFNPAGFDWELFFNLRKTGELFSTKFYDYTTSDSGIGELMNDSVGKTCTPSTDKEKGRDDFENHNAFWYTLCNFTVNDDGVKIPVAIDGQKGFSKTGKVDVGVLTPPLYWGEEKIEKGYIKHFSDSEHPIKRPDLTLTLMPHCRDNKGNPMPYGIVPVYYAGEIDEIMYSSSGLAVKNFMSYTALHTAMTKKGTGYAGSGSERSAYLKNFLWIKYKTLNSQTVFKGCTSYSGQYKNTTAATNVNYVTIKKTEAALFYIGATVSIGIPGSNNNIDRGQASMRSLADKVRVTKIENVDDTYSKVYVDGKAFTTTADTYISSMPLHSGQTDGILGNDGYVLNDGKHSFRIQGVEDGIGAYFVSSNEVMNKESATKTVLYARNGAAYSDVLATIQSTWRKVTEFNNTVASSGDFWIGEETVDLITGASLAKTIGSSDSKGTGDRYYFGGTGTGLREYLARANLGNGSHAGLSCLYGGDGLSSASWAVAACVA